LKNILIICPTLRDRRELARLGNKHNFIFTGPETREILESFQPLEFIDRLLKDIKGRKIDAVMGTHDYPASLIASIVAEKLGLNGVNTKANFLCQHKYYSRKIQTDLFGSAVPAFKLLNPLKAGDIPFEFPFFVKPVKSFFSIMACIINNRSQFQKYMEASQEHINRFVKPFNLLVKKYSDLPLDASYVLAEELRKGKQVTLEGCVYKGRVYLIGLTDSIMYGNTYSFRRFDYPSSVDPGVQRQMMEMAAAWCRHINYGQGLFNMEFFYNAEDRRISIIEVNPRMCSQFADLVEKVLGINTYQVQMDLALGSEPGYLSGNGLKGEFSMASSYVLRKFRDQTAVKVPGPGLINQILSQKNSARIEIYARRGQALSSFWQDAHSYRYGVINLGGNSRKDLDDEFRHVLKALDFRFKKI